MTKDIKKITPYQDLTSGKKDQVTSMFDKVAPYYDFLNRLLSLRIDILWRRSAIKTLAKVKPNSILDIATGTADLAIEAAKQLKPDKIVGLDISANMLKIGDKKIARKNLTEIISLELGDSENLQFEDESFDAITAGFGVRNFENLEKGLQEMYRVLKPGGNLMILEFSKPYAFPLKQGFNLYFKYMLPVIGKVVSKDPKAYQYLYESVQAFPDYEKFSGILKKLGFREPTFKPLSFGICTIYNAVK